ncbi:MAG: glycosyltransferase family 2 protein [Leptospiraceae bacterium]|nr:glycosyltransferase family 2 protein [Leptospiraceae bacterium]
MKVSLFIPVKDEIEGLRSILPRIKKEWIHQVVFIDGNSKDGSVEYIESLGYKVIPQSKPGLLNAWWEGFDASTGDVIIPFSPDNNSVPEDIPKLIEKMGEGYDIVIASRYAKGARSEDDDVMSYLANRLFTALINLLFRFHYTDALTMYKAFRKDLLTELKLEEHRKDHFEIMLACRAARRKLKVTEIPSIEPKRLGSDYSRAHPGKFGKYKSAIEFLVIIFRDWLKFK